MLYLIKQILFYQFFLKQTQPNAIYTDTVHIAAAYNSLVVSEVGYLLYHLRVFDFPSSMALIDRR